MSRVVIVVAPGAGIEPAALVSAWNADTETSATGTAAVETAKGQDYFPGLVELVVVPLVVNVASSAAYDLVKRLAARLRPAGKDEPQVEQAEAPGVTAGTYFLRTRLHDRRPLREAVGRAHYQLYSGIGPQLHELLITPGDPQARATGQALTQAEYANLTTALAWGLQATQPITGLIFPLAVYLQQTVQQAALRTLLDDIITAYPQPLGKDGRIELSILHGLAGRTAAEEHRLHDARRHHETELHLLQAAGARSRQGTTYHQLGRVAQEQRRFEEAEAAYRQALDIKLEESDPREAYVTATALGLLATRPDR